MSEIKLCTACDCYAYGSCQREPSKVDPVSGNRCYVFRMCETERSGWTWFGLVDRCGLDAKYFVPRKPRDYGSPPNEGSSRVPPPEHTPTRFR